MSALALGVLAAAPAPAPDVFRAVLLAEHVPDAGQVTNVVWYVGTNRFRIAPVPTWRVTVNQSLRRLEFVDPGGEAAILLRYEPLTNTLAAAELKELARSRHVGFRVEGETELGSGCGRAKAFDLVKAEDEDPLDFTMAARRTAFVVMEDGLLECTLSTALRSYEKLHRLYGQFLVGVRPDEGP